MLYPVSETLNIYIEQSEKKNVEISLYNVFGIKVGESIKVSGDRIKSNIDIGNYPPGNYVLAIKYDDGLIRHIISILK